MAISKRRLTQAQKIMVFVLSMCMFGLSDLITQLIPDFQIGPFEIGISYFGFIGLIMCVLLDPFYGAIGSCFGAIIFGGLLIGDFKGIGELESFIQMSLAFYLASFLVKNINSPKQIFFAGMVMVTIDKFIGGWVDIAKVWIGVEEIELVAGLPESILAIQGLEFLTDVFVTGIFFTAIPAMILLPRLHGKLEPLLGLNPVEYTQERESFGKLYTVKNIAIIVILSLLSCGFAILKEMGVKFLAFRPDFVEAYGDMFMYFAIGFVAILTIGISMYCSKVSKNNVKPLEREMN
ncbi:MAG: hypothetical protein ACRCST_10890 [Turicibacter sp.]